MKINIIVLTLFSLNYQVLAQDFPDVELKQYPPETLILSEIPQNVDVTIAPLKMNVLYIGVDNPLQIVAANVPDDKVSVTINQGSIRRGTDGNYIARVKEPGKATITVSQGDKVLKEGLFRVISIPNPEASVGGHYTREKVLKKFIQNETRLVADLENFVFEIAFEIVSYDFTWAQKGGDLMKEKTTSAEFTPNMIEMLKRCNAGDYIFIDAIQVKGPNGAILKLPSLVFEII